MAAKLEANAAVAPAAEAIEAANPLEIPELDKLPDEIYHFYIFKHSHLSDIWNFRLINKRFYSIVRAVNITELYLTDFDYDRTSYRDNGCRNCNNKHDAWFPTTRPIIKFNQMDSSKRNLNNIILRPKNNFAHLKYLKIKQTNIRFSFEVLNKFIRLKTLIVDQMITKNDLLSLPDLRSLSVKLCYEERFDDPNCRMMIDCPRLNSLEVLANQHGCHKSMKIINGLIKFRSDPGAIKRLTMNEYYDDVTVLYNLEYLEVIHYSGGPMMNEDVMKLPYLTKLRIDCMRVSVITLKEIDHFKNLYLENEYRQLEIVLGCVKIKTIDKIDEYRGSQMNFRFQMQNYKDLDDGLNHIYEVYYHFFLEHLPIPLPSDFFSKFSKIERIDISEKVANLDLLMEVIKGSRHLTWLETRKALLPQEFFNQLPKISLLMYLEIMYEPIEYDFKFIADMPYLNFFKANQDVFIDKRIDLNKLRSLDQFDFNLRNRICVRIKKLETDKYRVMIDANEKRLDYSKSGFTYYQRHHTLDGVFKFIEYLRSCGMGKIVL